MANILDPHDFINTTNPYPMGLRYTLVNGALAETSITLLGSMPNDKLIFVLAFISGIPTGDLRDVTEETTIIAEDTIRLSTTDTSNGILWVCWYDIA